MLNFIKDNRGTYTIMVDGQSYQFCKDHPCNKDLIECIKTGDSDKLVRIINVGHAIEDWSDNGFDFTNGVLMYGKREVQPVITDYIIDMMQDGFNKNPMLNYLVNLYSNPSNNAVTELHAFMQHKSLPITEDGHLIAHKGVKIHTGEAIDDVVGQPINEGDFVDKWTGKTHRNNVGDTAEMPRNEVEDNCNKACGPGLHGGSLEYAKGWVGGGSNTAVITIKVNPADVVSVPLDANCKKLRCCKYEVIGVSSKSEDFDTPVLVDDDDDDYDDEYDEDDEYSDDDE